MRPLLITSGEPAGIGPDICLALAGYPIPLVVLADKTLLQERAVQLGLTIFFDDYIPGQSIVPAPQRLTVWSTSCASAVIPGKVSVEHVDYVLHILALAVDACLAEEFSALVTAPVHKEIINHAGVRFTGHTEFLANRCHVESVVMLMVSPLMRVALVTTHLPLREVAQAVTPLRLKKVIDTLYQSLQHDFNLPSPKIKVAGLNPHAGEGGYLGSEEQTVIQPVIQAMQKQGLSIEGPFPADTLFVPSLDVCDAYVTMYHDQGLPVIKYSDFDKTVNVTLGLPIIRTSVDHGTALSLAGSGAASARSLFAAIDLAWHMAISREAT